MRGGGDCNGDGRMLSRDRIIGPVSAKRSIKGTTAASGRSAVGAPARASSVGTARAAGSVSDESVSSVTVWTPGAQSNTGACIGAHVRTGAVNGDAHRPTSTNARMRFSTDITGFCISDAAGYETLPRESPANRSHQLCPCGTRVFMNVWRTRTWDKCVWNRKAGMVADRSPC